MYHEVKALIEALEDELGVSASAPVMAIAGGAAGGAGEEAAEEKTEFDVELTGISDAKAKVKVIKEIRGITGLGSQKMPKDWLKVLQLIIKENLLAKRLQKTSSLR